MSQSVSLMEKDILAAIEARLKEAKEAVILNAVKEFETEIRDVVGRTSIQLANYFTVERMAHELVIKVKI